MHLYFNFRNQAPFWDFTLTFLRLYCLLSPALPYAYLCIFSSSLPFR